MDERVGRMAAFYSSQAGGYDRCWAPALHRAGMGLLTALPLGRARRVLEIGSGTGRLLADIRAAAPDALVVGTDPAVGMLALASGVRVAADAMAVPFRDGLFDVALACFVLHHLPSPLGGLSEARRVLGSDAVMGTTTWANDDQPFTALDRWVRVLDDAGAPTGPSWAISQQDLVDTEDKVRALFEEAGFRDVRSWRGRHDNPIGREEFFERFVQLGASKRRLEMMPAEVQEETIAEGRRRLAGLPDDAFVERDQIIYTTGATA